MSDYSPDIKALLDYLHGSHLADLRWAKAIRKLVAERDALAAEVAKATAERDEARRGLRIERLKAIRKIMRLEAIRKIMQKEVQP